MFLFGFDKFIYFIFIYFWLHWVLAAVRRPSPVAASGGYSSLRRVGATPRCGEWGLLPAAVRGPLIAVASPVAEHRL